MTASGLSRARFGAASLVLVLAVASGNCDRSPTSPPRPGQQSPPQSGPPPLVRVEVGGPTTATPGQTVAYTATAHYADGKAEDVTATAEWNPPATSASAIGFRSAGVAVAARPGENVVHARYRDKSGTVRVLVLDDGTFKLSGVVSDSGGVLSHVTVEVISGTGMGLRTTTDGTGAYALYGVAGRVQLRAAAEGLNTQIHDVVVTGNDATHSFALTPVVATVDISGRWTMMLAPSPGCRDGLPESAQSRRYEVDVTQQGARFQMRISGPSVRVANPGGFGGIVLGSHVRLSFPGDTNYGEWGSPDLYDQLSPTETYGFSGFAEGESTDAAIRAVMHGDLVYWNAPTFDPTWYCRATDHAITLRR